jgi:hypothetical protein
MRKIIQTISCLTIAFLACSPPETNPQHATTNSDSAPQTPSKNTSDREPSPHETPAVKLMEMEKRDNNGNLVGLLEAGLWYKRGEENPYTGFVVGMNKPKNGKSPTFPYNYKREYKKGIQVGVETGWYASGKKRIELVYENGEVLSMKQWDADGKEIKQ